MSADISDLPTPDTAAPDISDLPAPDAAAKTVPHTNYDATGSTADQFFAGAGKAFVDTFRGIRQIGAHLGITSEKPEDVQAEIDEAKQRDQALMHTKAGMIGNVVGQAAPALLLPEAGIAGSAAEMAGMGALQPTETGGASRLQNAGMGALGGVAGAVAGKAIGALGGFGIPLSRQAAVDTLKAEGIPLSVAQQTAAKGAQTVERSSAMISDAPREFAEAQGPAFNRAVMRRVGVNNDAPMTGSDVLDALQPAKSKITGVMDDVASRTNIHVDDPLLNEMGQIQHDAARAIPESDRGALDTNINDILEHASNNGGALDGAFYQKLNSNLGALSRDPASAPFAQQLKEAVDDALHRYADPQDIADLATARQQYRALKQIEPAIDNATGDISPSKLMNSIATKNNRNQALYGNGDQSLVTLARAAKQIIPDRLGNSGTPERMIGPLTVLETMREGSLPKAAVKLGSAIYGGGLAGRAMRNQGVVGNVLASGVPGLRTAAPIIKSVAPAAGYGMAEAQPRDQDQIERAAGGRVDIDALVTRLMNRWKQAKKQTDETTKPLLKVPDATIAKALSISQEHI